MSDSVSEARAFGRYVLGRAIDDRAVELYVRALTLRGYDGEDPVVRFCVKHRWSIAALDGALALAQKDAPLRKKLLMMAAILETQPRYSDDFLPRDASLVQALRVFAGLCVAVPRAGAGLLLLRFLR